MKTLFDKSLILKIGVVVLCVECLALTSLGLYYSDRFSRQVDHHLETNVQLPGRLMSRQLLRYESVSDRKVMTDLVGEEFTDGMVVGADGRIYYAYHSGFVGKSIFAVPGADVDILSQTNGSTLLRHKENGKRYLVSITPLTAYEGAKPFFHVYIKTGTEQSQAMKKRIVTLFIVGSAFCILLTSVVIITYTRQQVTKPLEELEQTAEALSHGELDVPIPVDRTDQIGSLANSFSAMRSSIRQKIKELEQANLALEDREGQLQALVDALPDRILLLDWEGRYLDAYLADNDNILLKRDDLVGSLIRDLYDEGLAHKAITAIRTTIETGETQEIEYFLESQDGPVWLEGRTSRIGTDNGPNGKVVWVARNITERKEMERTLTRAKEDTEEVNQRLRELDRTKSALVSSVSHELRTPLTSLLGFSKLILKNFSKNFWPMAKGNHKLLTKGSQIVENLNILVHEGDRLTRLINDVLDLNKIEMGYTNWREDLVDPAELAEKAANSILGQFNNNPNVKLVTDLSSNMPTLVLDRDKMLQVLLNLLTNAAKFTAKGTVTLRARHHDTNLIRFEVEDTGSGIPEDELERVFDIFHQVGERGPADDKPNGAGLGLAICREIVLHYHGSIWAESETGKGSTFFIELPV